jgi:peroxiredoxin
MIKVGEQAPDFELDGQLGKFKLSQFKGSKNVMLVFYPLDFTPN